MRSLNKILLLSSVTLLPLSVYAAEQAAPKTGNSVNTILVGLVSLIFILLIVIGILGNTLRQLGFVYLDKLRNEQKKNDITKAVLLLIAFGFSANYAFAQEAAAPVAASAPAYISGIPAKDFYLIMGVIGLEILVITGLVLSIRTIVRQLSKKPELKPLAEAIVRRSFWDRFNNVVAIEKEQDIMLDHDYDGIKELDNSLPPWWKYGFYFTILIAGIYLYYYHMGGGGPSSYQEYVAEVEKGEADKAAYLAKSSGNIDESTVKMLDAAGIASGKTIFESTCAACHAKDGGGGVGPNLTDNYWLHGGDIKDVFKSIKYGWADKGMKSWKDDFSPKQIAELASYIKSLKGTTPAVPKEKQGELYTEDAGTATDTAKTVAMVK